jgi:hypothetical protein
MSELRASRIHFDEDGRTSRTVVLQAERDVITRGVFAAVPDLKRKLMRNIREYNKEPRTVKWKYFDPTRRITPQSTVTVR